MKVSIRFLRVVALSVVVLGLLAGSALAATWKLSTLRPEGSPADIDVRRFADCGYFLRRAAAVDMFPGTKHIETVVCLSQ